jgi:tetratricopeptide (TPR) repeat protein
VSESLFEQYKAALRRGHMAARAGELQQAQTAYEAAARLAPERALPLASRGTILHRLDRWPEAAEAFDQALQLAPDDEAALRGRAAARAQRGMRSGAAADYERLAAVLDVAGRSAQAAQAARHASELEPTPARTALAERLGAAAAMRADLLPGTAPGDAAAGGTGDAPETTDELLASEVAAVQQPADDPVPDDPWGTALDPGRAADVDGDADAQTRAGDTTDPQAAEATTPAGDGGEGGAWPGIDLPSPPPPPIEGPPPDPESLLNEAALVLERGEVDAARELMLTAARVHRDAGRIDAALEICLNLLSIAPGEPRVHLAIANLQLDRGWTSVATEKLDLLIRLTSLTGDTQAAADVHGLASERLRDDAGTPTAAR